MQRLIPAFLIALVFVFSPSAKADSLENFSSAKQAILLDFETGMVLFEKNADQRMPTSSMSKVMTMYMVFEALKDGRLTLDSELPVSEKAWRKGGSKMFVEVGKRVRVEDLIQGVLVQSGNDATIVFAEGLAGSEEMFAEAMTARARSLGMKNSNFTNASGWPDDNHYSSARDLAILARSTIKNFPEYFPYFSIPEFTYNSIKQRNRNPLLYRDIGADGMKTGYTVAGGYGLIGTAQRNGRRVILVINGVENDRIRAQEGARLLEWGLTGFKNANIVAAGETVVDVPVVLGQQKHVSLTVAEDVRVTLPVTRAGEVEVQAVYDGPLVAPVKRDDRIGTLRVAIPGMSGIEAPLVAAADVGKLGLFSGTIAKAKLHFTGGPADAKE